MPVIKLNYETHVKQWGNCTKCPLHKTRKKIVLARGKIPATVLFIGEAPGQSEDVLGVPFIGPAGKLLDNQIEQAELEAEVSYSKLFSNLVGCIPKDPNTNRKNEEPVAEEIEACSPRLEQLFKLAKPKLIVCVGKLSEKVGKAYEWGITNKCKTVSIAHPAFILRIQNPAQRHHEYDKVVVQLASAFRNLGG